jgi:Flp pilus assembly protein CpaB
MDLPKEYVTRQMVSSTHLLVGRCTAQYVCKAEPVLLSDVLPARNGISSELAEGERAVTLHLQKEAMLDLLAEPGDLVDVMYTISHKGERYTRTICQQARVLVAMSKAAEAEVHGKQIGSSAITLAVTKGEAELLAHAQGSGKLQLVLRNRADREELTPETIVDGTVFPGLPVNSTSQAQATAPVLPGPPRVLPPPPPVMPPAQLPGDTGERLQEPAGNPLWSIEMFSGNKREVYAVPRPVH